MEGSGGFPMWQAVSLFGIFGWIVASSVVGPSRVLRSVLQPLVSRRVIADIPLILRVQELQHGFLDNFFSLLSCFVSVPFYTAFLPLLFWSGHVELARQMTLLIALCDYFGSAIKDLVSAPRPSCPPVRRITATNVEREHAMEYGLPSSHALNTVCLAGYLLHYALRDNPERNSITTFAGLALVCMLVILIGIARIYLGMHSVVDVVAGVAIGIVVLAFWFVIDENVDSFIISGQNVTSFCAALSLLLCFAYPTPELPTPSFEYHAAFTGVAFGIVSGVRQTFHQYHHKDVARIFTDQLPLPKFTGRVLVGMPTILLVKFCSKALAKWLLPAVSHMLGIPIRSSCYIPALKICESRKSQTESKQSAGHLNKLVRFIIPLDSCDVDTGIRFLQYAGLAWSVVDLVPSLFSHLSL